MASPTQMPSDARRRPAGPPLTIALDEQEWRIVRSLREIPPSPLRDRMHAVIEQLIAFVQNPGCPELQADGVPCTSAQMSCDRCHEMLSLMYDLAHRLRHA